MYFYDKARSHRGVQRSTPSNLFAETHLYSEIQKDGTRNPELEKSYSALESRAEPIVEKLIAAARAGTLPNLSDAEKAIWNEFFYSQWRRVPDVHNRVFSPEQIAAYVDELANELLRIAPHRAGEIAELSQPEARRRMIQNASVDTLSRRSTEVLHLLDERGLALVNIKHPRKQLIIGSSPVVKLTTRESSHISALTTEVWLPIAFDVMVGVGLGPNTERVMQIEDQRPVRHLNVAIARQSSVIAGASRELVTSLARQA